MHGPTFIFWANLTAFSLKVPESTLEKVSFHLKETTGDGSTEKLRVLMQDTSGSPEPTVRRLIAALLKFQGGKFSYAEAGAVRQYAVRMHAVVDGCLQRVGKEEQTLAAQGKLVIESFEGGEL